MGEVIQRPEKVDIHNSEYRYETAIKNFKKLKDKNEKIILQFLEDCERGKTLKNRAKKKIGAKRLNRLLDMLKFISERINKDILRLNQKQFEDFIFDFEKNKYKKKNGGDYSEETKVYYKKGWIKFIRWLKENHNSLLDTGNVETYKEAEEIPALTKEEIETCIQQTPNNLHRFCLKVLFDSGMRASEFLNLRRMDITDKGSYFMIRIRVSKTLPRTISLPLSTNEIRVWLEEYKDKSPNALLVPLSYKAVSLMLHRIGRKAISKGINITLTRHSSASYYSNRLNHFQLSKRYGWSMASRMPARYIDRNGVMEEETVKRIESDEITNLKEELKVMKEEMNTVKSEMKNYAYGVETLYRKKPEFKRMLNR